MHQILLVKANLTAAAAAARKNKFNTSHRLEMIRQSKYVSFSFTRWLFHVVNSFMYISLLTETNRPQTHFAKKNLRRKVTKNHHPADLSHENQDLELQRAPRRTSHLATDLVVQDPDRVPDHAMTEGKKC